MKTLVVCLLLFVLVTSVANFKVRTRCKCNFVLDDMPSNSNHTLDNIFPSKYRRSHCDDYALDRCRRRCVRKEGQTINGDLDQLYPNVNVPHAEILCYWLANDVPGKQVRIQAVLECARLPARSIETGITYEKPLTCQNGHYVP